MPKIKKPEAYRPVLRKRVDIVAWLKNNFCQRIYDRKSHPLCLNVKLYSCDNPDEWTFEEALSMWKEYNGDSNCYHDTTWIRKCREKWDDQDKQQLWDWGVDDVRVSLNPEYNDCYTMLWDGRSVKPVEFHFVGRSGGWLSLSMFEGTSLLDSTGWMFETRKNYDKIDFNQLYRLYQFCLMAKYDLTIDKINKEIKFQSFFNFFANICPSSPKNAQLNLHGFESEDVPNTIVKSTEGYVKQIFTNGRCVSQEFIAGDQVEYMDVKGNAILVSDETVQDLYQNFNMVQPSDTD